jgi:hypothetical protein
VVVCLRFVLAVMMHVVVVVVLCIGERGAKTALFFCWGRSIAYLLHADICIHWHYVPGQFHMAGD